MSTEVTRKHEARSRKARHIQEEMTQWILVRSARAKGTKDSKHSKTRPRARTQLNVGFVESAVSLLEGLLEKTIPTMLVQRGKNKNTMDAHILDSTKPIKSEQEVEIGGFDTSYCNVNAVEVRESEWIKIGVDAGTGKTAWPQSATHGKWILGDVNLPLRSAIGGLVRSDERLCVERCDDWGVNLRVRSVQALECKPVLSVGGHDDGWRCSHVCSQKGTCSTRARVSRTRSKHGSTRISAVHNMTVARLHTQKTTCTTST